MTALHSMQYAEDCVELWGAAPVPTSARVVLHRFPSMPPSIGRASASGPFTIRITCGGGEGYVSHVIPQTGTIEDFRLRCWIGAPK